MPESEFDGLRTLPPLSGLQDGNFERLFADATLQSCTAQIVLLTEGAPPDHLFILVSGAVELFAQWQDRETTMEVLRSPACFFLAETVSGADCLMSARTLEPTRMILVPVEAVHAILAEDAGFVRAVAAELADRVQLSVRATKNLKMRTSLERLANFILSLQDMADGRTWIELPTEKRKLASQLGMTPENLSRALKGLQAYGVKVDGGRVSVSNRDELAKFAKPHPLIDRR
ncbi:helix-turn-helix domain-containing protein [Thalassococcus sp. CAU 1522]|uniref:Helix-turn-helix domain-containing protein n=1 Tax=Thalassococcus arenae TaxID=2851652 RepID=A0ABS6NC76_9RHOB|nr:helix-turn-helix domain-containing protein [Thalassococcus arenae]